LSLPSGTPWHTAADVTPTKRSRPSPREGRSEHGHEPGHKQKPRTVTQDATRCRLRPTGAVRQVRLPLHPRIRPPRLLPLLAGGRPAPQVLRPTRRPGGGPGGLCGSPAGTPGAFRSVATVAATGGRRAGGVVVTKVATTSAAPSEAGVLAGELGKAFGRLV